MEKPLDPLYDLHVGAILQAKATGVCYSVGVANYTKYRDGWQYCYPLKDTFGQVAFRYRLADIRRRFTRPTTH